MPEFKWQGIITPQLFISAANFLAIVFGVGVMWANTTGSVNSNTKDIDRIDAEYQKAIARLDNEIARLRMQDTSIAVLKTDVTYIKDSIQRIEAAIKPR